MTTGKLIRDSRLRPELFRWNRRIDAPILHRWLEANNLMNRLPADLVSFWQETGGGELFETETMLGPGGDALMGDDIVTTNRAFRASGMPERFLVFHRGLLTSAVDMATHEYVELTSPDFQVLRRFASLDDWYAATLREEYGQRYNLV